MASKAVWPLILLCVPEFPVELSDPPMSLVVKLNKLPKLGSWFDLGDGTAVQAKVIRMIGGEPVIYAARDTEAGKKRLKRPKLRQQ